MITIYRLSAGISLPRPSVVLPLQQAQRNRQVHSRSVAMHLHHSSPPTSPFHELAAEDSRAGILVRSRNRVVDVDENARVRGLVSAGEGDLVGGLGAAAAGDGDLGARDVELGAARALGDVQADVLGAEEVVAGLDAPRDGDLEGALACRPNMSDTITTQCSEPVLRK
jgi:hypothetical protein